MPPTHFSVQVYAFHCRSENHSLTYFTGRKGFWATALLRKRTEVQHPQNPGWDSGNGQHHLEKVASDHTLSQIKHTMNKNFNGLVRAYEKLAYSVPWKREGLVWAGEVSVSAGEPRGGRNG